MTRFDTVIVGGGTAGCVLAARLSEDPAHSVLLLEAGDRGRSVWRQLPVGFTQMLDHPRHSWRLQTDPVGGLGGRSLFCPRGRGLGGSSAINGMIHVRGQRADFDDWAAAGNPGWSAAHMEPCFDRAFGPAGAIPVAPPPSLDRLSTAFMAAATHAGLPRRDDLDHPDSIGVGPTWFNIQHGVRISAHTAYLEPVLHRPNLTVEVDADVERIQFTGRRAVGVRIRRDGQTRVFGARREVVLCAGAVHSPHLLMRSGIGPADDLTAHGIEVRHHLPSVGQHLQDHFLVRSGWRANGRSLNRLRAPIPVAAAALRWLRSRDGALAAGPCSVGAFFSTDAANARPDVQLHFVPCSFDAHGRTQRLHAHDGMTACVYQLRPESQGEVGLSEDGPRVRPAHLDTDTDRRVVVAALRRQRAIFQASPLAGLAVDELSPGPAACDDADLLAFARQTGESGHHLAGSCRMGPGPDAVVDPQLRVHGVEGLRVADASVMPALVSANTHATTVAVAERAAQLIQEAGP